ERGDIVVFAHPRPGQGAGEKDRAFRVVAVEGDAISMHEGALTLNGELVSQTEPEPYEYEDALSDPSHPTQVARKRVVERLPASVSHPGLYDFNEYDVLYDERTLRDDKRQISCGLSQDTRCWTRVKGVGC